MPVTLRLTDPSTQGVSVIALIIAEDGTLWDDVAEAFVNPPRTAAMEIALVEQTPDFPAMHQATVNLPDSFTGIVTVRFEDSADATDQPISAGTGAVSSGGLVGLEDILSIVIPDTGVDGGSDITVGRYFLEVLSVLKGQQRVDRPSREMTLHLLGTNETLRTFQIVRDSNEATRKPPDAT